MAVSKTVLLLLLMSSYVAVNCQDSDPCKGRRIGKVPDPVSCSKYYECFNYKGVVQTCLWDAHYSTKYRNCVPIHMANCVKTTTPVTIKTNVCSPNMKNVDLFYKYEGLGKTYYISKFNFGTDVEAMDMCKTLCAYLAEIDDKAEGDLVIAMLESLDTTGMFIAGSDRFKEGDWKYDRTGRQVKYFNWCNGEPNNAGNENCMGYSKEFSCMWDYHCYYRYTNFRLRFLCEV